MLRFWERKPNMTNLEKKKMEVELMRVTTARMDLEYRILEMQSEIVRLGDMIKIQQDKEKELSDKLKG